MTALGCGLLQVGNQVGSVLWLLEASKHHLGTCKTMCTIERPPLTELAVCQQCVLLQ